MRRSEFRGWLAFAMPALVSLGCTGLLGDDYFVLAPGDGGAGGGGGGGAGGTGAQGGAGGTLPKPDLAAGRWNVENA